MNIDIETKRELAGILALLVIALILVAEMVWFNFFFKKKQKQKPLEKPHRVKIYAGSYFKNKIGVATRAADGVSWDVTFPDEPKWSKTAFNYSTGELEFLD